MIKASDPVIVVVDDEQLVVEELARLSRDAGLRPVSCRAAEVAMTAIDEALKAGTLVAVVSDLDMQNADLGWQVISYAYRKSKALELAIYTAYFDRPVHSLFKSGAASPAFTVFRKPLDSDKLVQWMESIARASRDRLGVTLRDADTRRVFEEIAPAYARSTLPILLLGETGTGKEQLALHVHHESGRPEYNFLSVNCGGLETNLAFGELFGHAAGAYTDAQAHELGLVLQASGYLPGPPADTRRPVSFIDWLRQGNPDLEEEEGAFASKEAERRAGTLFLDEVATLTPKVMAGLLRLLSTRDVRPLGHHLRGIRSYCRIIAATNEVEVLKAGATNGAAATRFRADLRYRLAGAILTLPPLRSRHSDDIRNFVENVVWTQIRVPRMPVSAVGLEFVIDLFQRRGDDVAQQYQQGNFRSLRDLVHRSALIAQADQSPEVDRSHIELAIKHGELTVEGVVAGVRDENQQFIRTVFITALRRNGVSVDPEFSYDLLKALTRTKPDEVGEAFLCCATTPRRTADSKKATYDLGEIETALTNGMARTTWLGKGMTVDLLLHAVSTFRAELELDCDQLKKEAQTLKGLVTRIQEAIHAEHRAARTTREQ